MKTVTEMTEKQQRAIEALEGARRDGVTLSGYAKTHELPLRVICRHKGATEFSA